LKKDGSWGEFVSLASVAVLLRSDWLGFGRRRVIKGTEIGAEIGFYHGCYATWKLLVEHEEYRQKIR
jgi:hypothetical protein